ncbi:glycosyltransferase family 2 protein [Candidatus Woesearchaeota archaeon]|nr:glycosyltransferase family 2 protein [Candidatus Woesearchaeota archaeon]
MQKLSIVIPCYNEEEGIPQLVQQLNPVAEKLRKIYELELIFVDDGSKDQTNRLLHQHFDNWPGTKIVKHEVNKNLGAALKTGFAQATGDLVAALDSDCTYNPALIAEMAEMIDTDTDIATVSPYHPLGKVNNVSAYRIFLSKSISRLYRMLVPARVYTFTAMVRVYKKDVVKNIHFSSDTFLGVTELMIKALLHGYRVKELPTELNLRTFGTSKMKTARVIGDHLGLIARLIRYKVTRKEI